MSKHSDTIKDWLVSNRLYEVHIFYYTLIVAFWIIVGFFSLGFEINGYSQLQNLFFNFIWYLVICVLMTVSLTIFYNTYETNKYEKYLKTLEKEIAENLTDGEKEIVWDLIKEQGHTLPTNKQRYAMLFLGAYLLLELFFISAWVKEMRLIWQPDWVVSVIEWVLEHTELVSISTGGDFFSFSVILKSNDFLYQYYQDKGVFLNSELGKSAMLFVFLKFIASFPILVALSIVVSKVLNWLGINHLINRANSSVWGFIWTSALMMFGLLMVLIFFMLSGDIASNTIILPIVTKNQGWVDAFGWNFMYIGVVFGLQLFFEWLRLIKTYF